MWPCLISARSGIAALTVAGADTVKGDTSDGTRANRVHIATDAIRVGPGRP